MVQRRSPSRRRYLLGAVGVALAPVAGCTDRGAGDDPDDTDGVEGSDDPNDDLDLREANVVDVAVEATDEGYGFDVTLHHDDDGEEGYANWWQVERPDGTRLGRRELVHAHSEQPFTRSETVDVSEDASCVVVRGHDQTHGYGGVAAVVVPDDGTVRRVAQGPDPTSFDASDCP
ncbi:hypothetical protein EKH57_01580 [Halorubrum sp. BOL3-1]|uniref:hypothetical protein n=1 Tax=Halorubrum sp. BOL3-1 TaxID=2497325 RepID=UPI0010050317|nr:hypothetical protein [Halorubrum sp. BOL3-1]QAU11557.1 hypothetical protein EKH57_01580 [Halorubrum sp. BOL3-1]